MSFLKLREYKAKDINEPQTLIINKSKGTIRGVLRVFYITDRKFQVAFMPALNVSGYGKTQDEARSMLREIIEDYFTGLLELKRVKLMAELSKFGWQSGSFKKRFENTAHVDKEGILRNLAMPKNTPVVESMVEVA